MKVIMARSELYAALQVATKAITGQSTLPVLKNVKLTAEQGDGPGSFTGVRAEATNLEVHIITPRPAVVERPGEVCVPGKALAEIVASLPECDVTLEAGQDGQDRLDITARRSRFKLEGLPPSEMPVLPGNSPHEVAVGFTLPAREFKRAAKQVAFAIASDETRPILTTCLVRMDVSGLVLAATDTHRLALLRLFKDMEQPEAFQRLPGHGDALVPGASLVQLGQILKDTADPVHVRLERNGVWFETADLTYYTRIVDGQFPKFERVIPNGYSRLLRVDREGLLAAVKRNRLVAREAAARDRIVFRMDQLGLLNLTAEAGDMGNAEEELEVTLQGEELTLALNGEYVQEVLAVLETDEVEFQMTAPLAPVVVRPCIAPGSAQATRDYLCVLMPMQVHA